MEVKFTRTYSSKHKFYAVGEINTMHGCAAELTEVRPRLAEGKLEPGEMLLVLFGITPEEYALRESDPKQLDKLIDSIRKHYPADRLIGYVIRDLKGTVIARQVKLDTEPTIDDGAFAGSLASRMPKNPADDALRACGAASKAGMAKDASDEAKAEWARTRKAVAEILQSAEELFVAYDVSANRYPAFGFDARIELFTTAERAENAHRQIRRVCGDIDIWTIRPISRADFPKLFAQLRSIGAERIRIDNGFAAAELLADDLTDLPAARDANVMSLLVRETQYGLRWNRLRQEEAPEQAVRGAMESALTMKNFARREIGNMILYIVCPGAASGRCATQAAMPRVGAGARLDKADPCVMITEKRDGKNYFTVFTSQERAAAFAKRMPGPSHAVAVTFDDVAQRTQCEGLILNIDDLGYRIPRADYDNVRELRAKPPTIVRVRPAEDEPIKVERPHVDSALPDPDRFLPKAEEKKPEPYFADAPAKDKDPADKTGFFGRLFGKKHK